MGSHPITARPEGVEPGSRGEASSPLGDAVSSLRQLLGESAFHDYVYSYPHKTSYRTLDPAPGLGELWAGEDTQNLSLYLHVPFCEMRCGFCNLFTAVDRRRDEIGTYLKAFRRQAEVLNSLLPARRFTHMAIGGGTPTLLDADQLDELFGVARDVLGADLGQIPISVESSPATATPDRVAALVRAGVDRVSIGVQSFQAERTAALKRPQDPEELRAALGQLAAAEFGVFNIDLMYGIPGQAPDDVVWDIDQAIAAGANELYLYPLYVRELTPLGTKDRVPVRRSECYGAACEALKERGWAQRSMRRFSAPASEEKGGDVMGTTHRCQVDGMLGVGVGARSYTDRFHYSHDYAVGQKAIRGIIGEYCESADEEFTVARHGVWLDEEERRRRFVILTLLDGDLDEGGYRERFGRALGADFPELDALPELGLAHWRRAPDSDARHLHLTESGVAASDTIGHWLFSDRTRQGMAGYSAK